ncbi:hypothetical protein ACWDV4_13030 [Micromonospora sp. NPDC003197]
MGRKFTIQGVEFDLEDIVAAHFHRGYTGGLLDLRTADGEEHTFDLYTRDSAEDFQAYAILRYESNCYTESWARGVGPGAGSADIEA